eukprot:79453_1
MGDIVEHTLCQIPTVYVFKLPPRGRADGWLGAEMTEHMWTGRLRIAQRGSEAAILLINNDDGKLFAMSLIKDGSVERAKDSSRYFVLKIQNTQGKHAFIGIAFNERNYAFDFNVALQGFEKEKEREAMANADDDTEDSSKPHVPTKDYSIKAGEKIHVDIGGISGRRRKQRARAAKTGGEMGGGGLQLAPPPNDTPSRKLSTGLPEQILGFESGNDFMGSFNAQCSEGMESFPLQNLAATPQPPYYNHQQ